jgi:hypothetical protein
VLSTDVHIWDNPPSSTGLSNGTTYALCTVEACVVAPFSDVIICLGVEI